MDIRTFKTGDLIGPLNAAEAKNAPSTLYVAGNIELLRSERRISVIGSRQASENGLRRTRFLTRELVAQNIIVVSGLAAGIDTAAHTAAIRAGGKTVAVLGTRLDQCYPPENDALQRQIMAEHLAVSQFPAGRSVVTENFPMRNRTMALLSDATVVVEAGEQSGTRHQVQEALRLGRAIFIMENVASDPLLKWPQTALAQGAKTLSQANLPNLLNGA